VAAAAYESLTWTTAIDQASSLSHQIIRRPSTMVSCIRKISVIRMLCCGGEDEGRSFKVDGRAMSDRKAGLFD